MEVEPSLGAWFPSEVFACERRSDTCPPRSAHEMLRTHRASAGRGLCCHTPTTSTHLDHSFLSFRGQFELCFLHAQPSPSFPGSEALPSVCAGALFPPWAPLTPCACLPPLPLVTPGLVSGSMRLGCSFVVCCCFKLAHIHTEALLSLSLALTCSMFQKTFCQKERGSCCCQTPPPLSLPRLTLPPAGQAPQPLHHRRGVPSGYLGATE